ACGREDTAIQSHFTVVQAARLHCGSAGEPPAPRGMRRPCMADTSHLPEIIDRLHQQYPNARYELDWENPLQLLVATILAAQCTDERVNRVTPALFAKYPDAAAFAAADQEELEELVRPTGYYRQKAK